MFNFFSKEDKQLYNMLGHLNMAEKEINILFLPFHIILFI